MLLAASSRAGTDGSAPTLRQVLQQNGVPTAGFQAADLDARVSSGAIVPTSDGLLFASPAEGSDGRIGPPLYVVVYDRPVGRVLHRKIEAHETSDFCFGSLLDVSTQAGYILLETHINPSAGCTIVLSPELKVLHTLFGWKVAQLGADGFVLQRDEVHFAPVHPAHLAVFDLPAGRQHEVYPPDGDVLRAEFSRDLKQHLPAENWCREHNHSCDPASFDEEVGESVVADASGSVFAFVMTYDSGGFGDNTASAVGSRLALYVYRRKGEGWTYCQQPLPASLANDTTQALKRDMEGAIAGCREFKDVTVAPRNSPFSGSR